jgi:hypothetical protein
VEQRRGVIPRRVMARLCCVKALNACTRVREPLQENCNSPSAWNFPECQKSGTRGSQSSPSVALGEELHSGKMVFPECLKGHGTRGRPALGEGHLPREQHSGKTAHEKEKVHLTAALDGAVNKKKLKKLFPECLVLALGEGDLFPECLVPGTRGRASSPSA